MSKSKRSYTEEFKKDAIRLALRSPSISGAAKDLGVPEGTLNTWLKMATNSKQNKSNVESIDLSEEIKNLRKEVVRLKEEKEILKKFATFFVKEYK